MSYTMNTIRYCDTLTSKRRLTCALSLDLKSKSALSKLERFDNKNWQLINYNWLNQYDLIATEMPSNMNHCENDIWWIKYLRKNRHCAHQMNWIEKIFFIYSLKLFGEIVQILTSEQRWLNQRLHRVQISLIQLKECSFLLRWEY